MVSCSEVPILRVATDRKCTFPVAANRAFEIPLARPMSAIPAFTAWVWSAPEAKSWYCTW